MLNQRIRELRRSKGFSQVELAAKLGVTKQSVSNWENDNIQPSVEMLIQLAKVFSVSTDYLLGLDSTSYLQVEGLSKSEIAHVQQIVEDIRKQ
ncbi:MAG: helix-turn-helix transcriptional regulator [Oscillospiraceae bacterium]|nr:helix-turn-helix transcriptional regulator [Oscillospiraceae bacterium]